VTLFKSNKGNGYTVLFKFGLSALQLQSMFAAGNSTQMAQKDQQQIGVSVQ
jgi:hypothetical protein